ncbi:DnaA regulatory inactivator Hda [Mycoavidus cysteinexigens]|uniref:DnaA regulatory inactivator Hda n=1 Tax=Mycoavidus cysteinexigens TaxID=1553431 RepID=UPI0006936C6E|nr:DnaA regulatory inactivator Hda [Mycoavidus cysteinexigens]
MFVSRQLLLDFGDPPSATFDNFITGANTELVTRLAALNEAPGNDYAAERFFYLWGEAGNGRSHLLHALCHRAGPGRARLAGPCASLAAFEFDPALALYAIDDCDMLSPIQQIAAFNLFNEIKAHPHCAFVATGQMPPRLLKVREDLRTRLGWGLVYQLMPLDDVGKMAALTRAAQARGIALAADVPPYLLAHFRRDMRTLIGLLDALDRFSLERHRPITLPLLRAMLSHQEMTTLTATPCFE